MRYMKKWIPKRKHAYSNHSQLLEVGPQRPQAPIGSPGRDSDSNENISRFVKYIGSFELRLFIQGVVS
jgi:hypothetical protein